MKLTKSWQYAGFALLSAMLAVFASAVHALDTEAALSLARQNNCFKCHSIEKKKDGPTFKEIATKYRGAPDGLELVVRHLTLGEKAKFPDGHEEEHKVIKQKGADIRNLAEWVLSQ